MIAIDRQDLAEARRVNRRLDRLPRFRVSNPLVPRLIQSLVGLTQIGADRRLRRAGIAATDAIARSGGHDVRVRVLRPAGDVRAVMLDIHGGAWVLGNARIDDALNVAMIHACGVAVVSVDYRLAPSASVEDMIQDCVAAARWVLNDVSHGLCGLPMFVVGESAGGHLAAATLLRLKEAPDLFARIAGAILYYGVYDLTGTPSVRQAGRDTLILNGPSICDDLALLTPDLDEDERRQPPLSPLYGDLAGFPPAVMFVGDRDPLLDDTLRMAERWRAEAPVDLHRFPEAPHAFVRLRTRMAAKALNATYEWVDRRMGGRSANTGS